MIYSENYLPLGREDNKLLKKKQQKMQIALIGFMLFGILMAWIARLFTNSNGPLIAVSIIIILPVSIYLFIYRAFTINDLKKGYKAVITGPIGEKKIFTTRTQDATDIDTQRRTQYYTNYYFIIGEKQINIPEEIFNQFETGDILEIHQTESEVFLGAYPLNDKIVQNNFELKNKLPLSESDKALFYQVRNKTLLRAAGFTFVFGFIAYWVILFIEIFVVTFWYRMYLDQIVDASKWILILVILIIAWFTNKKLLMNFFYDSKQLEKFIHNIKINDKLISNTRLKGDYQLVKSSPGYLYVNAGGKFYYVTEKLYNEINPGDEIIAEYTVFTGIQLKVDKK